GTTGATTLPSAFTMSVSGQPTFKGSSSGTTIAVNAGTYTLSETGPSGYTASAWTCVGGSQSGNQITLTQGQSATCSITNTAIPPTITVTKTLIPNLGAGNADTFNLQ